MALFSSASDTAGLVICAGVLIRLRDKSPEPGVAEIFRRVLAHRRVTSLMAMAACYTGVRLVRNDWSVVDGSIHVARLISEEEQEEESLRSNQQPPVLLLHHTLRFT